MVIAATDGAGFCNEQSISYVLCPWGLQSKWDTAKAQRKDGNHLRARGCY